MTSGQRNTLVRYTAPWLLVLLAAGSVGVQQDPERILRRIADRIIAETSFQFADTATEALYDAPGSAPPGTVLRLASPYNDWRYWNGVLAIAMRLLGEVLPDARYARYPARIIRFGLDHAAFFEKRYAGEDKWTYPFGQLFRMEELDDCGAMGAAAADLGHMQNDSLVLEYVRRAARHLRSGQKRLPDRTFARDFPKPGTVWADDLFMSVPFLARLGFLTGHREWFDDAALQVESYHARLFDEDRGLMAHFWYSEGERRGTAFWGRANGWALLAQVELLDRLPADHPRRDVLVQLLRRHLRGVERYQHASGLWHQLLDREDAYLETSCSAMFTYAIARAVRQGYCDPSDAAAARKGWAGVCTRIRPDGRIEGVCTGTVVSDDPGYYLTRPTPLNDIHGTGAVLLAGAAVLSLH